MCQLVQVSRVGFYRHWQQRAPDEEEMAVRAAIQEIALTHRCYGRPRVTHTLRQRGMVVNHKRVGRIMQEDNLLAIRRRKFILTTDSRHDYPVYLNLAARMTLSGINQLWIADVTYIRLRGEFVYLAVVLDRYSRKVIGWAVGRKFTTELVLRALQHAVAQRRPPAGVVHHSDRGVQYCAREYTDALEANQMTGSMSRPANPYDNAACESFMKTLKQEEIYCTAYRDLDDLSAHLEEFIEGYYNRLRLHSALGYRTPEQFEAGQKGEPAKPSPDAATMRLFSPPDQEATDAQKNDSSNA
jgi:transposase InsO family protein